MLAAEHNSLNFVRLCLALMVLWTHAFTQSGGVLVADPFIAMTGYKLGDHAVNVFFVISGIVTTASLSRSRSLPRFLAGRGLRIVPAVFVVSIVMALIAGPLLTSLPPRAYFSQPDVISYIARTSLFLPGHPLLPGVFATNPMPHVTNEPLWTVKYELICYLMLAVAGGMLAHAGNRMKKLVVVLVIAACVATTAIIPIPLGGMADQLRSFVFCYSLGVAAYLWADSLPVDGRCLAGLAVLTVALATTRFYAPLAVIFTGYAALWAARFSYGPLRAWANRTDLSYGIYILHWPVAQILAASLPGITIYPLMAATTAIVMPLAWISWTMIERPALAFKAVRRERRPGDGSTQRIGP